MKEDLLKSMKKLLGVALLLLALGVQAHAQAPTPTPALSASITLTGGPNPSPAVIGNTVRVRWSAKVEGGPAERAECLTQKASYTWSVDSLTWTPSGGTAQSQPVGNVTLTSSNDTASASWVADKAGRWNITVRVVISYTGTECGGAWSGEDTDRQGVDVQDFVLHPSPADFNGVEGGAARVLISKTRGDAYYSINLTTRPNERGESQHAQSRDGQVTITAHLPPAGDGTTIYFRVVDPDDASPYEPDTSGDDNHGGALLQDSDRATLTEINGNRVAAAEVVLNISNYSGDNYIVEASGDPAFPAAATQHTALMVGWKRAY